MPRHKAHHEPTQPSGLILSGLRTLEAEAGGIAALSAAMQDGLGTAFTAAVDAIRAARGRVVVTGMGKSGHIGRKIAATLSSTGTPALFVHPAEASHGDLGMITADDVIMALSWSGETVELKNLIDYSRRYRIGLIAVTADAGSTLAKAADVVLALAAGARSLPAQPGADHVVADAACARRRARDRAAGKPRIHGTRFRRAASGRPARRSAEVRARPHAQRREDSAGAARRRDGGRAGRDDRQGVRLRGNSRPRAACRDHHRRRPAPQDAPRPARAAGRRSDDQNAEDDPPRCARKRGARAPELVEDHGAVRDRKRGPDRDHPSARPAACQGWREFSSNWRIT